MSKRRLYYSVLAVIITILVVVIILNLNVGIDNSTMEAYHSEEIQNQSDNPVGEDATAQGPLWIKRTILDLPPTK